MRKISQLPVVKQVDADFPNGAIINETDTNDGTPVVREIYNDILVNAYKVLDVTGVEADGEEDKEGSYQLVEALQKLPSLLNGVEHSLSLSSGVWSIPVDLAFVPNKYIFIARATDAYVSGTFKGLNATPNYTFTSAGFNAGDEVLIIKDNSGVRAYSLMVSTTGGGSSLNLLPTIMGMPLQYNNDTMLRYQSNGKIMTDAPTVNNIQSTIRTFVSDAGVLLTDMFITQNKLICVVYFPTQITYKFYDFNLSNLNAPTLMSISGFTIPVGADFSPYFYADDQYIYITNDNGTTVNDNRVTIASIGTHSLSYSSLVTLDTGFVKTTNGAFKNKNLYTFVSGKLSRFDINTGALTDLGLYDSVIGQLFSFKDSIYFGSGEIAQKWF